jgi:hypothetical protein
MARGTALLRFFWTYGTVILTLFFVLVFVGGQWFLPFGDSQLRILWNALIVGLLTFLRAAWKPSEHWKAIIDAGRWLLILAAGIVLLLMGVIGLGAAAFVQTGSTAASGFLAILGGLLFLQGYVMIRYVDRHRVVPKEPNNRSTS